MPEIQNDVKLCELWKHEGLAFLQRYGQPTEWETYQNYYEHNFGANIVPLNKFFSIMRSLVPRVYFRNPRVMVTPRKPGLYWKARLLEAIDNWLLREKHFKEEIKLMIQDAFLYGLGIGIVGYDNSTAFSGQPLIGETDKGEKYELNVNVKSGEPWFLRIHPKDVIFPYGTKTIRDMPWFGQRVIKYTRDIKNNPMYENTDELKGTHIPEYISAETEAGKTSNIDQFDHQTTLWIFRNARTREVLVMAEEHPKLLYKGDDALQMEGLPLTVLNFNPTGRSVYGIPDARIILPQQELVNDINTILATHARTSIKKWLVDQNKVTPEEWNKAMNDIIGATLWIDGSPEGVVAQTNLQVPQELISLKEFIDRDVREQVGFSRQSMGEFSSPARKTATEVAAVDAALAIRVDERRDAVADVLVEVVSKWNQYIFSFWDTPMVQQIVGIDGQVHWVSFTGQEIQAEYAYEIDPDDAVPTSGEVRKQEALIIGQQLTQLALQGIGNIEEIIRQTMKHFPGWDVDAILRKTGVPQTPMQQAPQSMGDFEQGQAMQEQAKPLQEMQAMMAQNLMGAK